MIKLTKLNSEIFYLNPDLIGSIECHPNTTLNLTSGEKIIVKETPKEITENIVAYKKRIYNDSLPSKPSSCEENRD